MAAAFSTRAHSAADLLSDRSLGGQAVRWRLLTIWANMCLRSAGFSALPTELPSRAPRPFHSISSMDPLLSVSS